MPSVPDDVEYFDHLVNLIPAKFYFPVEGNNNAWKYRHKSSARAEAKRLAKELSKRAKRLKLDPSLVQTSLQVQKELEKKEMSERVKAREEEKERGGEEGEGEAASSLSVPHSKVSRASSHDELALRLKQKLQELRSRRNSKDLETVKKEAKEWVMKAQKNTNKGSLPKAQSKQAAMSEKSKNSQQERKRKREGDGKGDQGGKRERGREKGEVAREEGGEKGRNGEKSGKIDLDFEFGKLRTSDGVDSLKQERLKVRKNKRAGKLALGKEATNDFLKKGAQLEREISRSGENQDAKRGDKSPSLSPWKAAAERASGRKVLDNPTLLKRSMKREEKRKEKSSKQWSERKGQVSSQMKEREKKRTDNIKHRQEKTVAKRIEKREKKLMRPGFEGRVGSTPLNKSKKP